MQGRQTLRRWSSEFRPASKEKIHFWVTVGQSEKVYTEPGGKKVIKGVGKTSSPWP